MDLLHLLTKPSLRRTPRRCTGFVVVALLLGALSLPLVGCGSDDTGTSSANGVDFDEPPVPDKAIAINTVVEDTTVIAGEPIDASCEFVDGAGNPVEFDEDEAPSTRILQFPDDGFQTSGGELYATRAGDAKLACQSHQLGLTDTDPVDLTVKPGPAHTTAISLSDHQIVAGDAVEASCEVFDEFGNFIPDADVELIADTSSSGIVVDNQNLSATVTIAGIFTFSCLVDGADDRFGAPLEVLPHLPAELSVSPVPNQEVYGIGQVISVDAHVVDRYGNRISRPEIEYDALPTGESFGEGRFRFHSEGIYTITIEVTEPTFNDEPLYEEIVIIVNDTGPDINCIYPADGQMIDHSPGQPIVFEGTVADAHGTDAVFVNGQEILLDDPGTKGAMNFDTEIDTEYGINFIDIVAHDYYGEENVRTCAFLVSDTWAEEDAFLDDAIALSLFQPAVDDGQFTEGEFNSLNDLIMTALNSQGLEDLLNDELADGQKYDVGTCGGELEIQEVILLSGTPHVTSMNLVDGGLTLSASFYDVVIDLRIETNTFSLCLGATFSPDAEIGFLDIDVTADLELDSSGRPNFSLRQVDNVNSGNISLSGSNAFSDLMYSAIDTFFQGTLQGVIEDTFEDAITDNFDDLFSGIFESLDVESLGTSFDVPRLDSDDEMRLNFDFRFSSIEIDPDEAQFGLGPRIYPGPPHVPDSESPGANSLGVPHPPGPYLANLLVPNAFNPQHSAAVGAHVVLLNQALHSLWRAGLFHANVGGALGDDLPDGVSVELAVDLPPMLDFGDDPDDGARLMLGAAHLELVYPGIFDEPVSLTAGAIASTGINLDEEELSFDAISIDEFYLSPQGISLNAETRDILEDFIQDLLQDIIDQSLNSALPALPIPSFEVPDDMTEFDLPQSADIGIYNTSFDQHRRHLELYGSFGVQ